MRNEKYLKYSLITLWVLFFLMVFIRSLPSWVLNKVVTHYSNDRLKLYNVTGTFWHGSGLLVASDVSLKQSAPLILVDWNLSVGFKKFIDIKLSTGSVQVGEIYLTKDGINLDNINLYLSLTQVSSLLGAVQNLDLSGNVNLIIPHALINKKSLGEVQLRFASISSNLIPVNPLGSYMILYNLAANSIAVSTITGDVLNISGNGDLNSLVLKAQINGDENQEKMEQFMTALGVPNSDGSYSIKIF